MKILFSVLLVAFIGSGCANKRNATDNATAETVSEQAQQIEQNTLNTIQFPEVLESDKGDDYTINSAEVKGNQLIVEVAYSGGCKEHEFELLGDRRIMKSLPPQMNIVLKHNANQDMCRALITTTLIFDITPAQEYANGKILVLRLLDHDDRITYNF